MFNVSIISVSQSLYAGQADFLMAPATEGDIGILPRHAPLLTKLRPGAVRLHLGDSVQYFYVAGGFLEVQPDQVLILADEAHHAEHLDENMALSNKQAAETGLKSNAADEAHLESELAKAIAQLDLIRRLRREK